MSGQAMLPNTSSLLLDPNRAGLGRRVLFTKSLGDVAIENRGRQDPESVALAPKWDQAAVTISATSPVPCSGVW